MASSTISSLINNQEKKQKATFPPLLSSAHCPPPPLHPSFGRRISSKAPDHNHLSLSTWQLPMVPVGGGCYSDGMEMVWHGEFSRHFVTFYPPHVWYLTITSRAPLQQWKFHRDSAKVRFCCQDCGNGWTSMKGRVTFWFHLDIQNNVGFVQFKLYGQQCKKCNSGKFEYVMWYPEEVSKVMSNLYHKVGQTYYGFFRPPIRVDRRPGRPRNQHNATLCQACKDGECDQGRSSNLPEKVNDLVHASLSSSIPAIKEDNRSSPMKTPFPNSSSPSATPSKDLSIISHALQYTAHHDCKCDAAARPRLDLRPVVTSNIKARTPDRPLITPNAKSHVPLTYPLSTAKNQFFYHPSPNRLAAGPISFYPQTLYPVFSPSPIVRSIFNPVHASPNIAQITELMTSVKLKTTTQKEEKDCAGTPPSESFAGSEEILQFEETR